MASPSDDITTGYNEATGFLQPYYDAGLRGFKAYQGNIYNMGRNLMPYNKSADSFYDQIGQSPQDFYNSMMSGYSESPYAQNQMNAMEQATTAGASASGMYGSTAYNDELQNNANNIMMGDQQQYYNNMMDAANQQYKYLTNLQGQQAQYRGGLNNLANYGYGSANTMGQYAMQKAQLQAQLAAARSAGLENMIGGIAGAGAGLAGLAFL